MDSRPQTNPDVAMAPAISRWSEGVTAEMPLLDGLESIFRLRCELVLHLLPRATVYDPKDSEPIHKLRVAARRLSAVLDVLAAEFPNVPRKRLVRTVEKIRRACGTARDLDVRRQFLEALLPRASVEDAGIIEILCDRMIHKREKMQRGLGKRLLRLERKLRRDGAELNDMLELMRGPDHPPGGAFGERGARILLTGLDTIWSRADSDLESERGLHLLRIACKQMRYAAEIFFPALDPQLRENYYSRLEEIQELLGEIHDSTVAPQKLRKQHRKWRRRRREQGWTGDGLAAFSGRELRVAVDGILNAYAAAAAEAQEKFRERWPDFSGEGFRLPVTRLLIQARDGEQLEVPDGGSQGGEVRPSDTGLSDKQENKPAAIDPGQTSGVAARNGARRAVLPTGGE